MLGLTSNNEWYDVNGRMLNRSEPSGGVAPVREHMPSKRGSWVQTSPSE
jgi:hypothetical protein